MAHNSVRAWAWCLVGMASSTFVIRWFQQRCSAAAGCCSARAVQRPRWPSAIVHRQGFSPRARRSRSTAPHDSFDSRWPLSTASTTLQPSVSAPISTNRAALVSSSPALTYKPSAQTYTTSRSSSRRRFHASYSSCHWAFKRASDVGERGAASPSRPRRARSKSPNASPCRYSWGSNSPTSRVRRLKSGSTRLTNRSPSPRTRGRRTVTGPAVSVNCRGLPYPLRRPWGASTAARRTDLARPKSAVISSSNNAWRNRWTCSRTNASNRSQISLDDKACVVVFCSMAVSPFLLAGSWPGGFGHPRGYTAFLLFPHLLVIPLGSSLYHL